MLYVLDRNFLDFGFLACLLDRDNDFVLRVRSNAPAVQVLETLPLTAADVEAGVVRRPDRVELTGRGAPAGPLPPRDHRTHRPPAAKQRDDPSC